MLCRVDFTDFRQLMHHLLKIKCHGNRDLLKQWFFPSPFHCSVPHCPKVFLPVLWESTPGFPGEKGISISVHLTKAVLLEGGKRQSQLAILARRPWLPYWLGLGHMTLTNIGGHRKPEEWHVDSFWLARCMPEVINTCGAGRFPTFQQHVPTGALLTVISLPPL